MEVSDWQYFLAFKMKGLLKSQDMLRIVPNHIIRVSINNQLHWPHEQPLIRSYLFLRCVCEVQGVCLAVLFISFDQQDISLKVSLLFIVIDFALVFKQFDL